MEAPVDQHCPVSRDDDDDLAGAVVRPLAEDDPALAARLAARFLAALRAADLSPAERDYLDDYKPAATAAAGIEPHSLMAIPLTIVRRSAYQDPAFAPGRPGRCMSHHRRLLSGAVDVNAPGKGRLGLWTVRCRRPGTGRVRLQACTY